MFEKHRAKKAQKEYEARLAEWQEARDSASDLLELAETYGGERTAEMLLKPNETVYGVVHGASLIEDRASAGHWEGRSQGMSIPVGSIGGRSIRYRVGSSRGHFVQGTPTPTAIDIGALFVTNQRAIFQGDRQTRECRFDKLVGIHHLPEGGTVFSVTNRQKPTTVYYGAEIAGWFEFRLDLALAHYRNEVSSLVAQLKQDLATIEAAKPTAPALPVA